MKTIPIRIGGSTLVGYDVRNGFPIDGGNCFDLIDVDGSRHRVVNFGYENLIEWIKRTGQTDITVRCIPKSDKLWEICDERIPKEWYNGEYCTVCTPLRMLPIEQRKEYLKNKKFSKTKEGWLIVSSNIRPKIEKIKDLTFVEDVDINFGKIDEGSLKNKIIPIIKK